MTHTASPTIEHVIPSPATQGQIATAVRTRGLAPVARTLRVSRAAIASYLSSTARDGTVLLVEARAHLLSGAGQ